MASQLIGSILKDRGEKTDTGSLVLAGLLHDIGRVIFVQQLPEHYRQIRTAEAAGTELLGSEMAVTGMCHTDFGRNLLKGWNISEDITLVAQRHHAPVDQGVLADVVHRTDAIAHGLGFGYRDQQIPRLITRAWETLGLTNSSMRLIAHKLLEQIDNLTSSMLRQPDNQSFTNQCVAIDLH